MENAKKKLYPEQPQSLIDCILTQNINQKNRA